MGDFDNFCWAWSIATLGGGIYGFVASSNRFDRRGYGLVAGSGLLLLLVMIGGR